MEVINLLKFLNYVNGLFALDFVRCNRELVNFLDLMTEDEQFTRKIDLGIIYISKKDDDNYVVVDGLGRLLSLSLLLHAICECYKKTTPKNDKAIKTIRSKYLYSGKKLKMHLPEEDAEIYSKILSGERLSGKEKAKPIFVLLHNFWSQIKEEKLSAAKIFNMLDKIQITVVETNNVSKRDLYYKINSANRKIDQIALIDNFLKENKLSNDWNEIKEKFFIEKNDALLFLKDFFITKFNYKTFNQDRLYESFVNYFETMTQYMSKESLMQHLKHTAGLYFDILNLSFENEDIRKLFIEIKKHGGEDTYAYILSIYEDFVDGNISESIFIEILNTIDEYLKNRQKSGKNIDFNELVQYLNAFITCK